jgi:acetyl-CoA C-acetyltransferase
VDRSIFVLGGYQSDFARNLQREGGGLDTLTGEVVEGALGDAALDAERVGVIHVGNAFGELFTGQAHLGAMPASVCNALWGVPAARHEAACASGSVAILAAMAELEAGRYECALVIGIEQERNVPGEVGARHLGAAAWVGREGEGVKYLWPHMFSRLGDAYEELYGGLRRDHLTAIARKNFRNARENPRAQTRSWILTDAKFREDDAENPVIEGRIRRHDCGQVTDGAAAIVIASAPFAIEWARARGRAIDSVPRLQGWGHRTAGLSLAAKLARYAGRGEVLFPHVRRAITDALVRAGLQGPEDLHGIEVHDCFTTTEYMAIDHFGLTAPGESWKAIEDGRTERDGSIPVNPSGGLIGGGHPVGATGVRMVLDAALQVSGRAGATQVEGARTFATLNLGGSATTAVSFVVGRGARTAHQERP